MSFTDLAYYVGCLGTVRVRGDILALKQNGAYTDKAYLDGTYTDGACIDKAYIDRACIDKAYTDRAYTDRAYSTG